MTQQPRERSHIEEPIPVERHEFPVNRWAEFTDDELDELAYELMVAEWNRKHTDTPRPLTPQRLRDEIMAELERRKTNP